MNIKQVQRILMINFFFMVRCNLDVCHSHYDGIGNHRGHSCSVEIIQFEGYSS